MPKIETTVSMSEHEFKVIKSATSTIEKMHKELLSIEKNTSLKDIREKLEVIKANYKKLTTEQFPMILQLKLEVDKFN